MRSTSATEDAVNFIYIAALEGALHAGEGRLADAELAGRRALDLAEQTDYFFMRTWVRTLLAETLTWADRADEASALASEARPFSTRRVISRAARACASISIDSGIASG